MSSYKEMLGPELIKFAAENNLEKLQACIVLDVDINTADDHGSTAAHKAAGKGHIEVIRVLAGTGKVDWNKVDNWGFSPFHVAIFFSNVEVVTTISQQENVNFSLRTSIGNTAANLAVNRRSVPCVEILVNQENCDAWNILNQEGDTPILASIRLGNAAILKILLKCPRVDPNFKDENGDSPVMLAIKLKKVDLARLLIKCPRVDLGAKDGNGSSLQKIARLERFKIKL